MGKYLFKMILAGSGGVGKTTLRHRFTSGSFTQSTQMTIGVDFSTHSLDLGEVGTAMLQIWDFGGEDRFRLMLPSFCRGAKGCLLLFDLMRAHTFFELPEWMDIIRNNTNDIPVILLGAKCDLVEGSPELAEISQQDIEEFMEKNNIMEYIPVSSKTGLNIEEAFHKLTLAMIG
ncbi:MAG: Rab family GTPase [Promethearchaeota archaeon]